MYRIIKLLTESRFFKNYLRTITVKMIELKDTVISMNRFINIETIDKNIKRKSGGGR